MKVSRVYRLLRLIVLLQTRRSYNAEDLARELEVSRRTVFRDLNTLEMARIPYYFDEETGGYRISEHFFLPPLNLTLTEALAMLVLAGRLRGTSHLPLLSEARRAAIKLENAVPSTIREEIGSVIDRVSMVTGPTARHDDIDSMFDELTGAIVARRVCRIVYISFRERRQLTLDIRPLRLIFQGRAWYLLAHSVRHREVRTFKLGRIRKLTVTRRTFTEPGDVDPRKHFGQAWNMIPEGMLHDVHLHFEPKVAGNVAEVRWHDTQQVDWNDDGSCEFRVTVDGLGEITWWILGYGDQVRVVSPPELRQRIGAIAARTAASHGKEGR